MPSRAPGLRLTDKGRAALGLTRDTDRPPCPLCGSATDLRHALQVDDEGLIWRVEVNVCRVPACLAKRGVRVFTVPIGGMR
jgi:hypothetical protein